MSIQIAALAGTPMGELYQSSRLPKMEFTLLHSFATDSDSDRMRAEDGGRSLYLNDLDGSVSRLVDPTNGATLWEAGPKQFFNGAVGGQVFYTEDGKCLCVKTLGKAEEPTRHEGYIGLGLLPNGSRFWALDSERHFCQLKPSTGERLSRASEPWPKDADVSSWFSPCGRFTMVQVDSNVVEVWELEPRRMLCRHSPGRSSITRMRPHPKLPIFAMSTMGGSLAWIDCTRPQDLVQMPLACESRGVGWSSDGRYLCAANSDQHELIWVLDFAKRVLNQPLKLPSDPWGLAVLGTDKIAVARSNQIDVYRFEARKGE